MDFANSVPYEQYQRRESERGNNYAAMVTNLPWHAKPQIDRFSESLSEVASGTDMPSTSCQLPPEIIDLICEELFRSYEVEALLQLRLANHLFNVSASWALFRRLTFKFDERGIWNFKKLVEHGDASLIKSLVVRLSVAEEPEESYEYRVAHDPPDWSGIDSVDWPSFLANVPEDEDLQAFDDSDDEDYDNSRLEDAEADHSQEDSGDETDDAVSLFTEGGKAIDHFRASFSQLVNLEELILDFTGSEPQAANPALPARASISWSTILFSVVSRSMPPALKKLELVVDKPDDLKAALCTNGQSDSSLWWAQLAPGLSNLKLQIGRRDAKATGGYMPYQEQPLVELLKSTKDLLALDLSFHVYNLVFPRHRLGSFRRLHVLKLASGHHSTPGLVDLICSNQTTLRKVAFIDLEIMNGSWVEIFESLQGCKRLKELIFSRNKYSRKRDDVANFDGNWLRWSKKAGKCTGGFLWSARWADWHALRDLLTVPALMVRDDLDHLVDEDDKNDQHAHERARQLIEHYESLEDYRSSPGLAWQRHWDEAPKDPAPRDESLILPQPF